MSIRLENSSEKKRPSAGKKRSRSLSFYAAILLCAGAVALTALTNRVDSGGRTSDDRPVSDRSSSLPFADTPAADEFLSAEAELSELSVSVSDVQTTTAATVTPAAFPSAEPSRMNVTEPLAEIPEIVPASAPISLRMPTGGSVTAGFSGDELVFCATMCDWRVHNGIDISGEAGGEVRACADGIVENFAADMLYGNTAIVRHADDSVMYYCGLSDTKMVSAGLEIHAGDVIGYIGEVPCELEDGPHLHLAMMKDGKFIDPSPLLGGK